MSGEIFGEKLAYELKEAYGDHKFLASDPETYGILADMVIQSGDGDYVEIGTWQGASAIVAALTKKRRNLGGRVYCVDHFKGFNGEFHQPGYVTKEDAEKNIVRFGVMDMVEIHEAGSIPFPIDRQFSCAFIDGDHWGDAPYKDFLEIKGRVDKFILMDDYDSDHEDVQNAVQKIIDNHDDWKVNVVGDSCILFERIKE